MSQRKKAKPKKPRPKKVKPKKAKSKKEPSFDGCIRTILEHLGLWQTFMDCSASARNAVKANINRVRLQPLVIRLLPGAEAHKDAAALKAECKHLIESITTDVCPKLPVTLFWNFYISALQQFKSLFESNEHIVRSGSAATRASEIITKAIEKVNERINEFFNQLTSRVIIQRSSIEKGFFDYGRGTLPGGAIPCFELDYTPAECLQLSVNGKGRPAYRVGGVDMGKQTISENPWCDLNASVQSEVNEGDHLPVYVQAHTLRRLTERVSHPVSPTAAQRILSDSTIEFHLCESLRDPKIIHQPDGSCLVEYRCNSCKLGYLVVKRVGDAYLIATFLFLTMDGTPEGKLLQERLRIQRPDLEFNNLDRWSTFITSDLAKDPELVRIFTECGCGSLFITDDMFKRGQPPPLAKGVATGVKQYLGIASN